MDEHPMTIAMMIWLLFTLPALVYFSAVCAYFGLFKSRTITHFGIRSGWVARVYGILYLLFTFGGGAAFVYFSKSLTKLSYQKLSEALLFSPHFPNEISLFLIGMGVIMWLVSKWAERKMITQPPEKIPTLDQIRKYRLEVLVAAGTVFLCGLLLMTDWPFGLTLIVLWVYTYGETVNRIRALRTGELL